jgi:hypothetical protein
MHNFLQSRPAPGGLTGWRFAENPGRRTHEMRVAAAAAPAIRPNPCQLQNEVDTIRYMM